MTTHPARFVLAGLLALAAACGGDPAAGPDAPTPPTTVGSPAAPDLDAVRAELDALEFESPTVDGVSVLGNEPLAESSAEAAEPDAELAGDCPDVENCDDEPRGSRVQPVDAPVTDAEPFSPPPEWAAFCSVLAQIEERPFPTDDLEGLRTIDLWFGLLEPWVPALIAEDFAVLDRVIDDAVAAQDRSVIDRLPSDTERSAERIGDGVDAGCSGRGDLADLG